MTIYKIQTKNGKPYVSKKPRITITDITDIDNPVKIVDDYPMVYVDGSLFAFTTVKMLKARTYYVEISTINFFARELYQYNVIQWSLQNYVIL